MRFAHLADCHLGSWRQPELQELNLQSFKKALEICIEEKVDFIIMAGDLFDSAYPPIEVLKETFSEFKILKEKGIKCYIIAGSHDYSVSGKTFLDVLEKSGFCEICKYEEKEEKILLKPFNHAGTAIYGYQGKKSGMEVEDIKRIVIDPLEKFKILILHTTMTSAKGNIPIESVDLESLPDADYYALGHLHLVHEDIKDNKYLVYPGPIFPNNFQELEDLKGGSFYIVNVNGYVNLTKKELRLKEVLSIGLEIENALTGTEKILSKLNSEDLKDKIVLLKLKGAIKQGKTSDINFQEIEEAAKNKGAYILLKNTSKLKAEESEITIETDNINEIEDNIIETYQKENPSQFNKFIQSLTNSFNLEKQEDEKSIIFENRLLSEINKVLNLDVD